jgi:hypothetical protein
MKAGFCKPLKVEFPKGGSVFPRNDVSFLLDGKALIFAIHGFCDKAVQTFGLKMATLALSNKLKIYL